MLYIIYYLIYKKKDIRQKKYFVYEKWPFLSPGISLG